MTKSPKKTKGKAGNKGIKPTALELYRWYEFHPEVADLGGSRRPFTQVCEVCRIKGEAFI